MFSSASTKTLWTLHRYTTMHNTQDMEVHLTSAGTRNLFFRGLMKAFVAFLTATSADGGGWGEEGGRTGGEGPLRPAAGEGEVGEALRAARRTVV